MTTADPIATIQCVAETDPPVIMYARPRRFGIPSGWIPYNSPFADEYFALIARIDRAYVIDAESPVSQTEIPTTAAPEIAKPARNRQRFQTKNSRTTGKAY